MIVLLVIPVINLIIVFKQIKVVPFSTWAEVLTIHGFSTGMASVQVVFGCRFISLLIESTSATLQFVLLGN